MTVKNSWEEKYEVLIKKLRNCSFEYTEGDVAELKITSNQKRGGVTNQVARVVKYVQNSLKTPANKIVWQEQKLYADGVLLFSLTPELTKSE